MQEVYYRTKTIYLPPEKFLINRTRSRTIISIPALNQERALATLVPHTTTPRGSRFEVKVQARFLREGVFDVQNIVTIPHAKLLRKLGNLTSEQMMEVENALLFWLGFEERNDQESED